MSDHTTLKRCNKCQLELPTTEFYKDKRRPNSYYSPCKKCRSLIHGHTPRQKIPEGMKRCCHCKTIMNASSENFYRNGSTSDGLVAACKSCVRASSALAYRANPEKRLQDSKRYREANAEKCKVRQRRYRELHREEISRKRLERYYADHDANLERRRERRANNVEHYREKDKQYRKNLDPEVKLAKSRQYRERNRTSIYKRVQAWNKAHPEVLRAANARRRAKQRELIATFTPTDWQNCLDYFDNRCAVCNRPIGLWHTLSQDHWIPVASDGGYTPDNIVPLCYGDGGCNNSKCNRDATEWLNEKFGPRKAKQIAARIEAYFQLTKERADAS